MEKFSSKNCTKPSFTPFLPFSALQTCPFYGHIFVKLAICTNFCVLNLPYEPAMSQKFFPIFSNFEPKWKKCPSDGLKNEKINEPKMSQKWARDEPKIFVENFCAIWRTKIFVQKGEFLPLFTLKFLHRVKL